MVNYDRLFFYYLARSYADSLLSGLKCSKNSLLGKVEPRKRKQPGKDKNWAVQGYNLYHILYYIISRDPRIKFL